MADLTITVVSTDPLQVRVEGADLILAASGKSQLTGDLFTGELLLPGTYELTSDVGTVTRDADDPHLFTVTG
jgi:hypothetical protein